MPTLLQGTQYLHRTLHLAPDGGIAVLDAGAVEVYGDNK